MISVHSAAVRFGGFTLFSNVSFVISPKERIALAGKNGAGKSTMLKLIAGIEEPSEGSISRTKGLRIAYLPQVMTHADGRTVYEECEQVFNHIRELQQEVDRLGADMAERTDYDSPAYLELIGMYSLRSDELSLLNSGNYHANIERTLLGLGFEREDFGRPTSTFSGGWRMRIELAKLLLQQPDILLLDEPTNHLDIESIRWLERFIATSQSALLLISHDQAFLDATTTRTIEIELGRIHDYKANYSHYLVLRAERLEQQRRAYENQQKSIQETEEFIERFRYKATKAVQVQSRIKQLEKVERIELEEIDRKAMHFQFMPAIASGTYPIVIEELSKSYGTQQVINNVNLTIKRGEKVAFVGKNGSGKSTLIKCITGEITDYTGALKLGHQVEIGYFAQSQAQELRGDLSVYDTIDHEAKGDIRTRINDLLGAFMFGGEASEKKVSVLSGGERGRLAIIKLLLHPANVLILDEPTNHLDIRSKEVLKDAIKRFDGTVILVSHDRVFLDGLVDRIYEFGHGQVIEHMGGIADWLQRKDQADALNLSATKGMSSNSSSNGSSQGDSMGAIDYQKQKEESRKRRAIERELEQLESRSEELDGLLKALEVELSQEGSSKDNKLFERYEAAQQEQTELLNRWETLAALLHS